MVRQSQPASPISSMRKGLFSVSQALNSVRRSFAALRKRSSRMKPPYPLASDSIWLIASPISSAIWRLI